MARQLTEGTLAMSVAWEAVAAAAAADKMMLMLWSFRQPDVPALVLARICW